MTANEANLLTLEAICKSNNLPDVFTIISESAKKGRGEAIYPSYNEGIAGVLSCFGYYCYPTSNNRMVISWNVKVETYWYKIKNE